MLSSFHMNFLSCKGEKLSIKIRDNVQNDYVQWSNLKEKRLLNQCFSTVLFLIFWTR